MDFSIWMGLADVEYTRIESYTQLHVNLPTHLSPDQV